MIPPVHTTYPKEAKFAFGQRVLVHQSPGMKCEDGVWEIMAHDCDNPEHHWESRIVGWNKYQGHPDIATRVYDNPCHADWTYSESSLSTLEGDDWISSSRHKIGDELRFRWDCRNNLHYRDGTILDAKIEVAHIKPGDWYVSFLVPDKTWRFKIVVNEKDFM